MKVGYLGPKGSFTHAATLSFFKKNNLIALPTIISALKKIETKSVDYVVVPIENSIEGTVNQTLDFVYHHSKAKVQGEIILPINQNLMIHPNSSAHLEKIKVIKSHPQALAQTQQFLDERFNLATQEVTASTTEAAKWLHDHPNELVAAVASLEAAKMYGLDIIYPNIQDVENNQTRFWIIGHENITKKETSIFNKRRSIGVSFTENKPGNLHKVLSVFSWREIDLTKIESRPLRTQLGEYFFLIDIQNESPSLVEMAILELEELGGVIKELGTYPVYLEKAF